MRSFPTCWNKTLAQLGFRRTTKKTQSRRHSGRHARIETLEPRAMLAITVNTLEDVVDQNPATMSLREAIAEAASASGPDVIQFDASLAGGTIALTQGELVVDSPVTIEGIGRNLLTIDAQGASRVFQIKDVEDASADPDPDVQIQDLTITGGYHTAGSGLGGGVYATDSNTGDIALIRVDVVDNFALNGGGGVYSEAHSFSLIDSNVLHNTAGWGGGIRGAVGAGESFYIANSTIAHNTAEKNGSLYGAGGGVFVTTAGGAAGEFTIVNSTISNNHATNVGGGIASSYDAAANLDFELRHVTVADNSAAALANPSADAGAGIYNGDNGPIIVKNTVVANNRRGEDPSSPVDDVHNAVTKLQSFFGESDGDAKLSELGRFGGESLVHLPLAGSPLIDGGQESYTAVSTDQRGASRLIDHPTVLNVGGNGVDIGAVEGGFLVTTLSDRVDGTDGVLSLREALAWVNGVNINPPTVEFARELAGETIKLELGELEIANSVTIRGPQSAPIVIDAQGLSRVLKIDDGNLSVNVDVGLSDLVITGGSVSDDSGGGIYNTENLRLDAVHVVSNVAKIGGGMLSTGGSLEIANSTFDGNVANWGGAAWVDSIDAAGIGLVASTFSNNRAQFRYQGGTIQAGSGTGGALVIGSVDANVPLTIVNTTISSNGADRDAGGVYLPSWNVAPVRISNATITENHADSLVGGVYNTNRAPLLHNTIVAGNTRGVPIDLIPSDIGGSFDGAGSHNLIGTGPSGGLSWATSEGNILGGSVDNPLDPRLGPLADNGGPTKTHALLPDGPAIDHGRNSAITTLELDQRGGSRKLELNEFANANGSATTADIGAYELETATDGAVGDFNGDGREDVLRFNPVTQALMVAEAARTAAGWELSNWGSLEPLDENGVAYWTQFVTGDFNGDGRDDLWIRDEHHDKWHLLLSDGSVFAAAPETAAVAAAWPETHVGDFDGDGAEEVLGRPSTTSPWNILQYESTAGVVGLHAAGSSMLETATFTWDIFVADVNLDGRDDLLAADFDAQGQRITQWLYTISGDSNGLVSLNGSLGESNWLAMGSWGDTHPDDAVLNAGGPFRAAAAAFEWVYNNVELELYPGLMKGPAATEQTQAGNPWDQAALLEQMLQAIGVETKIAKGRVRAPISEVRSWLAMGPATSDPEASNVAVLSLLRNAFDESASLVTSDGTATSAASATHVEFVHAWNRVRLPSQSALDWFDVDASWKLRRLGPNPLALANYDDETNLDPNAPQAPNGAGLFNEFGYLALNLNEDHRTPVDYFEEQLADWLTATAPGLSLADVPLYGHVIQQHFDAIPRDFFGGVQFAPAASGMGQFDSYNHFNEVIAYVPEVIHSVNFQLTRVDRSPTIGLAGPVDINNADGMTPANFETQYASSPHNFTTNVSPYITTGFPATPGTLLQFERKIYDEPAGYDPANEVHAVHVVFDSGDVVTFETTSVISNSNDYPSAGVATGGGYVQFALKLDSNLIPAGATQIDGVKFRHGWTTSSHSTTRFRNLQLVDAVGTDLGLLDHLYAVPEITVDATTGKPIPLSIEFDQSGSDPALQFHVGDAAQSLASAQNAFDGEDKLKVTISHVGPSGLTSANPSQPSKFVLDIGAVVSIGLDANQHSPTSLTTLQKELLDAVADNMTVEQHEADIHRLLGYAAAKYWHDFNASSEIAASLTRSNGVQQWVGSGIVASSSQLYENGSNGVLFDQFAYGIAPAGLYVDLPNINHAAYDAVTGELNREAVQLIGYNSSALEHAIVEEVISHEGISTMKGLQRAAQENLGLLYGTNLQASDHILVYESEIGPGGVRNVTRAGTFTAAGGFSADGQPISLGDLQGSAGHLEHHRTRNALAIALWNALMPSYNSGANNGVDDGAPVTVLIPYQRSNLGSWDDGVFDAPPGSWEGDVYIVERFGPASASLSFKIAQDNKDEDPFTPINGAAAGHVPVTLSGNLASTQFTHFSGIADPVNISTGNMYRDETDFVYANIGVPLTFSRHYDAKSDLDFGMGVGWMYSFGDVIYEEEDPENSGQMNLVWLTSQGVRHVFDKVPGVDDYVAPTELQGKFEYTQGGSQSFFVFKDVNGIEHHFDAIAGSTTGRDLRGRLRKIVDRNGNGVQVNYYSGTNHRKITTIQDVHDANRILTFHYGTGDSSGIVVGVQHPGDTPGSTARWDFSYVTVTGSEAESNTRLKEVKSPTDGSLNNQRRTVAYVYFGDSTAPTPDGTPWKGLIKRITESDGSWHEYEYYYNKRAFRVTQGDAGEPLADGDVQSFTYNIFKNQTDFTDERGNTETHVFQDNGLRTKQIHPDRTRMQWEWGAIDTPEEFLMQSSTDEVGAVEAFDYYDLATDGHRQLKKATEKHFPGASDPLDTTYTYVNPASRPHIWTVDTIIAEAGESDERLLLDNAYDAVGRLTSSKDAEFNVSMWQYYTAADSPAYLEGLVKSATSPLGNISWRVLDTLSVTSGELSVRLRNTTNNKPVTADAIRVDRLDGSGNVVETFIVDNDTVNGSIADGAFSLQNVAPVWTSTGHGQPMFNGDAAVFQPAVADPLKYAQWRFQHLEPGTYRVSATWVYDAGRDSQARYELFNDAPGSVTPVVRLVDHRQAPNAAGSHFQGFQTDFNYDAAGNVVTTTADGAPPSQYLHNAYGQVTQSIDATDRATETVYNVLGEAVKTGFAGSAGTTIDPDDDFASLFAYDGRGRVSASTDPLGNSAAFTYDRLGNVLTRTNPDLTEVTHEYDGVGNRIATTDELGRTTRFAYDARNRLIQTIQPDGASEWIRYDGAGRVATTIDATGRETRFSYDALGRVTETVQDRVLDGLGRESEAGFAAVTTNKYNVFGELVESIDPVGNVAQFEYDKLGRVVVSKVQNNATPNRTSSALESDGVNDDLVALTINEYDANGRIVRTAAFDAPDLVGAGNLGGYAGAAALWGYADSLAASATADDRANVQIAETRFDSLDRPVTMIYADGASTHTRYDGAGRVLRRIDELGNTSSLEYDEQGRLAKTISADPDGAGNLPSLTTEYVYDAAGNQIAVIGPRGADDVTRTEYDEFNRPAAAIDALGNRSRSVYDAAGQMVLAIDALGRAAYTLYDNRGRAVGQWQPDPDGHGGQLAPVVRNQYDAAGRLIEQIDERGYPMTYEYDYLGRLVSTTVVESRIIDDGDVDGFQLISGDAASTQDAAAFDGDSQLIADPPDGTGPINAVAQYWFPDVHAGEKYRIAAHWNGHPGATSSLWGAALGVDAGGITVKNQTSTTELSQQTESGDFYRNDDGAWRGWEYVDELLPAGSDGEINFEIDDPAIAQLVVHLSGAGGDLLVDAVRLERLVTMQFEYDLNGNLVAATDPLGRVTDTEYDELDRVAKVLAPAPGEGDHTPAESALPRPITTSEYDGFGNVISVEELRGGGANKRITTYEYDARNRVVLETLDAGGADEFQTESRYDAAGNLRHVIELPDHATLQRVTSYEYDNLHRLLRETTNATDPDPNPPAINPFEQRQVDYVYNAAGDLARTEYDAHLYVNRKFESVHEYDLLGRATAETQQWTDDAGAPVDGDANNVRTNRYQYDAVGQLVAATDPLGRTSRTEYDRLGRIARSIGPRSGPSTDESDQAVESTFSYDPSGNLVVQTNGAGESMQYVYDARGRRVRSIDGNGDATLRRYDAVGNLLAVTDAAGNVTAYAYDDLNRLTSETTAAGSRQYVYDPNGNLAIYVDRNGRATTSRYDRLDRPTYERWYGNETKARAHQVEADPASRSAEFWTTYDALGRATEHSSRHFRWTGTEYALDYKEAATYERDALDRVVSRSNESDLTAWGGTLSNNYGPMPVLQQTHEYGGTERPQVTTLLAIDGVGEAGVTSDFSPFGELRARIDADAAISTGISFDPTRATFSYDASGALIESVRFTDFNSAAPQFFENHLRTRYAYDGAGRIASLTHDFATGDSPTGGGQYTQYEQILGFGFGYDAANRIDGIDTAWNVNLPGLGAYDAARSDGHDYDDAGQLQQVDRTVGGQTSTVGQYAYDENGNRFGRYEQGDLDFYAQANGQNRLSEDDERRYSYDAEGNLTAIVRKGAPDVIEQVLAYDHRNRLTEVEQYDGAGQLAQTVTYCYDAADNLVSRRVEPVVGAATVEFYRSDAAGRRFLTLDAQKDVARRFAYGPTGEVLFDQVFDGLGATSSQVDQHLPIGDHQHTTRAILDGADDALDPLAVHQSYEYAEFGTITHVRDAAGNELLDGAGDPDLAAIDAAFLWHGAEHDGATGRSRMGRRWYDPDLGRFLTEDSPSLRDGPNPYRFAGNDPVNFADPTGTSQAGHPLSGGNYWADKLAGDWSGAKALARRDVASTVLNTGARSSTTYVAPKLRTANAIAYLTRNRDVSSPQSLAELAIRTTSRNLSQEYERGRLYDFTRALNGGVLDPISAGMAASLSHERFTQAGFREEATSAADVGTMIGPQGDVRDVYEVIEGKDLIKQTPISGWNRVLTLAGLALPLLGGAFLRRTLGTAADGVDAGRRQADDAVAEATRTANAPTTPRSAGYYDADVVPGPNPNGLRQRSVTAPTPGEGGVYLKPQDGKTKVGSTVDYNSRYGPNADYGIEVEIPQTRTSPPLGIDDSNYPWTPRAQRRFDEEYVDRITPSDVRYRDPNRPVPPVSQENWERYRDIFGYGDLPDDFGL